MASNTKKEHKIHLEEVFKWLQQRGLVVHLEKCIFLASSVEFLGQVAGVKVPFGSLAATVARDGSTGSGGSC